MVIAGHAPDEVPVQEMALWTFLGDDSYERVRELDIGDKVEFVIAKTAYPDQLYFKLYHGTGWKSMQQILATLKRAGPHMHVDMRIIMDLGT